MSWTNRIGKKVALVVASASALLVTSDFATAQTVTKDAPPTKTTESESNDAAIFAKYDRLDAPETKTKYKEILANEATKKALVNTHKMMIGKTVYAKGLAKEVTPLVAGLGEDEVALIMDVIMRHYYLTTVAKQNLKASQVETNLEKRARALDSAVFGKGPTKNRALIKRRTLRRARR